MKPIDSFIQDFMKEVAKHREVTHFLLFGTAANGKWHLGSDVDIVICLSENSNEVKEALVKKFWEFDRRHGTNVINAKAMHPPIIFFCGWRKELFRIFITHNLFMKLFRSFDRIQKRFKRFAPTYSQLLRPKEQSL